MPNLDLTELEQIANVDFDTFRAFDQNPNLQNIAADYYEQLRLEASNAGLLHVENYARLAESVVNETTVNGIFANNYTSVIAAKNQIDFSAGSDNRLQMQFELMKEDLRLRKLELEADKTGELNFQETILMHERALSTINLPPEAFSLYTPFSLMAVTNPGQAQFIFQTTIADDGVIDLVQDGILTSLGIKVSADQPLSEIVSDYAQELGWYSTAIEAGVMTLGIYSGPGDVSKLQEKIEVFQIIADLATLSAEELYDWIAFIESGGLENLAQEMYESLPASLKNLISKIPLTGSGGDDELQGNSGNTISKSDINFDFTTYLEDGTSSSVNINTAEGKFYLYDVRISNFETYGQVVETVSGTAVAEGVQYNTVQTTRALNGELVRVTEYTLPAGAGAPANGVVSKTVYEEVAEDGTFYQKRVTNEVTDGNGLNEVVNQRQGDENSNWSFRINTHTGQGDGEQVKGDVFHVPSQDLQFALETAGGSLGSFLGNQLADGNKYQEIIYSSLFKTAGENFGSFASFLTANSFSDAYDVVANGAPIEGTVLDDVAFREDFFKNFNLKISSVVGGAIIDELGEELGLDGFSGGIVTAVGDAVTAKLVSGSIDVVFGDLSGTIFSGLADGSFWGKSGEVTVKDINGNEQAFVGNVTDIALSAAASYSATYLANKIISPESQTAGLLGSLGSAYGAGIANGSFLSSYTIGESLGKVTAWINNTTGLTWLGGPMGVAIGTLVGTLIGTVFGNIFGEEEVPQAWATVRYDQEDGAYEVGNSWSSDGGDATLAAQMAAQVIQGVNEIIEISQGKLRSGETAPNIQIGYEGNKLLVAFGGGKVKEFETSADAMQFAALRLMKDFDLVGGHMVVMRAWHNSDATNIYEWLEDIQIAEAFQQYLANPTAILALMMNEPDSELAQSWAAILQRAAELELHLPHEKDLDGGWGEILLAQGVSTDFIPNIEGDTLTLTDPATGEERVLHHIIGPGYEIVRIEGTDGDDIIEVIVDGPSITYVDGGEGNDTIEGSDQADVLVGGTGDDIINGHGGNDWLHGGAGNDTLDGGAGEDLVVGGEQNDVLYGDTETDHIYGNGGDDQLYGNEGKDFLFGGRGNDILDPGEGSYDEIYGGEGDDIIYTGDYHQKLYGGKGNDTFIIDSDSLGNHIRISRGEGHDVIEGKSPHYSFLKFDHTISAEELLLKRESDDLIIYILGEDQSVTLRDYYGPEKPYIYLETFGGSLNAVLWDNSSINGAINNLVKNHLNIVTPTGPNNVLTDDEIKVGKSGSGSHDVWRKGDDIDGAIFLGDDDTTYTVGSYEHHATAMSVTGFGTIHGLAHSAPRIIYAGAGNDTISGGGRLYGDSGDDTLNGSSGKDTLVGGLGNDFIDAHAGKDTVIGGHGDDVLYGGSGSDTINGGIGDDDIFGEEDDDDIDGSSGNDTITGDGGVDLIRGGEGQDNIFGGADNDTIHGGRDDDAITGDDGNDTIFGDDGNDVINGGSEDDWISGGIGNDIIDGGAGNDIAYGGEGDDTFIFNYSENSNFENEYIGGVGTNSLRLYFTAAEFALPKLQSDIAHIITSNFVKSYISTAVYTYAFLNLMLKEIQNVEVYVDDVLTEISFISEIGTDENDVIISTQENDVVLGMDGDDTINGREGNDDLRGGRGNDIIESGQGRDAVYGDEGDDIIKGNEGDDYLFGGLGNDIIHGGGGSDQVDGGNGIDAISFTELNQRVVVDLSQNLVIDDGFGSTDYLSNIENVIGTEFNDIIDGDNNDNVFYGEGGIDRINFFNGRNIGYGGIGNDRFETIHTENGENHLYGDTGNDSFFLGDNGKNIIDGGLGNDVISYNSIYNHSDFFIDIRKGIVDKNNDGIADDIFDNIERAEGGRGNDVILGDQGSNNLIGHSGNDIIKGGANYDNINGRNDNDTLIGGAGNDIIRGGNGDDIISGQDGFDRLTGESGADIFVFEKATAFNDIDWIEDFDLAELDQIDVSGLLEQYDPQVDDVTNFVQITDDGTDSFLSVDVNGTANNFIQIAVIKGVLGLGDVSQLETNGALITDLATPLLTNGAVKAEDDVFAVEGTQQLSGNVLSDNGNGKDWDEDNDFLSVVVETVTTSNGGSVTLSENGDFNYVAPSDFSGLDSFDYTIIDGNGGSDIGTVNITVSISNLAPQAQDDVVSGNEDAPISGNVLSDNGNGPDSDPDGDNLNVVAETIISALGGTVIISENGDFTYTPQENFNGLDNFDYTVQDIHGVSSIGTVTINVAAENDTPTAMNDSFINDENQTITGNLIADNGNGVDLDLDGDSLSVVAETITSANGGIVTISENGDFSYTPASGFFGTDNFNYTLTDGNGEQAIGTVNITINEVLETINGTESNDIINGTEDSEIINGLGGHDDIYTGAGDDQVFGGTGNDEFIDQGGNDFYDGGDGTLDQVNYSESATAIIADIEAGTVDDDNDGQVDDTLIDIEWITGTNHNDNIGGSAGIDRIYGGEGNDVINGLASNDILKTDGGNDIIYAGEGNDYIELGTGDDAAYGEAGNDNFHVTSGTDFIDGGEGNDTINYIYHNHAVNIDLAAGTVDDDGDNLTDDTLVSIEKVQGSNFSDVITGNSNNDDIRGNSGDDIIDGAEGDDTLRGGNGDDTLKGGAGADRLYGQAGADIFVFDDESTLGGVDTIEDFSFTDIDQIDVSSMLNGYEFGVDDINNFVRLVEEGSHSFLEIDVDGTGAAYVRVARLKNTIDMPNVSTLEADNILVTVGLPTNNMPIAVDDDFTGDENQDITGNILADNGNGLDSDPDGDTITVVAETITSAQGGTVVLLENGDFIYTPATDFFGSDSFSYTLNDGNGGNSVGSVTITVNEVITTNEINGTTGNDVLHGTEGNDIINADAGNDNIYDGAGDDQVNGGAGNDTFYYHEGNDIYDGGEGTNDRVNYVNATQSAIFDLRDGTIDLGMDAVIDDTIINIESVTATNHDDILHGNTLNNTLTGLAGDDEIYGYEGNDKLYGFEGDDVIYGGAGNDSIYGKEGTNTLYGEGGADKFYVDKGNDTIDGGTGSDFIYYQLSQVAVTINLENGTVDEGQNGVVDDTLISIEHAQGSNYDDIIIGASDQNSLYGRNGNDVISGQDGNDTIFGGRHDDILYGQGGADKLYGQQDSDTFVFEAATAFTAIDQIMDFNLSENDKIDLSDLLSQFDETTDSIVDFVQITDNGPDSILSVDSDGGADNFVQIATLKNITGLTDEEGLKTSGNIVV
jgi:Ca2+-binding RTX toxin-like protein